MRPQQENFPVNVMDTQAATQALHRAAEMARKTSNGYRYLPGGDGKRQSRAYSRATSTPATRKK